MTIFFDFVLPFILTWLAMGVLAKGVSADTARSYPWDVCLLFGPVALCYIINKKITDYFIPRRIVHEKTILIHNKDWEKHGF